MDECIFCKIVSNEIKAIKVFENNEFVAFLDIHPVSLGHTLVIPKQHFDKFELTPLETVTKIFELVRNIAPKIAQALGTKDFNISINNGVASGQSVWHTHVHVIPRKLNDGLVNWEAIDYQANEIDEIAKKIRAAIKE